MGISPSEKRTNAPVLRSLSPGGRFHSPAATSGSSSSSFATSTSFSFSSPFFTNGHHKRSTSPTRVNLCSSPPHSSTTFSFSIDRSTSPSRSISVTKQNGHHNRHSPVSSPKKTCMCSPTSHRGSFRCNLHKQQQAHSQTVSYTPNRLNLMRSAMKNSVVRIGGVEGEWVKRALTALIRPCAHQQRRRADYQTRPSRLSVMSRAGDS